MALAHHLIVVVYNVIRRKEDYVEFGADYYDQRNKPKVVARLLKRLQRLGYEADLREIPAAPTVPSGPEFTLIEPACQQLPPPPKRGRPCKCSERGIPCKHLTSVVPNSLNPHPPLQT